MLLDRMAEFWLMRFAILQSIAALPEPVAEEQPSNEPEKPERTRAELWEEIKILCLSIHFHSSFSADHYAPHSLHPNPHLSLPPHAPHPPNARSTLPPRPRLLRLLRALLSSSYALTRTPDARDELRRGS